MKTLVTTYKNPDLDGTACIFGYTEFLHKSGASDTVGAIFGDLFKEAVFVLKKFDIPMLQNAEEIIDDIDKIILVDASDFGGLSDKIIIDKVVLMIDHRKINDAGKFPNAESQIELVGSAATLIAEKFFDSSIEISEKAAALLFSAIISNTVNFQAYVTTDRDIKMAEWLKTKFPVPEGYIHDMFYDKSQFEKPIFDVIYDDLAEFTFNDKKIGIGQIEIIEADNFIDRNITEIKNDLEKIKKKKSLDVVFLTCIDIEKAFNKLVVIDEFSQNVLERALDIKFENSIARKDGVTMRKQIIPLIKEVLEK